MTIKSNNIFDVVISGGGLAGSLMALSLAGLKKADGSLLSIAIIETTNPLTLAQPSSSTKTITHNTAKPLFDDRVLALSHASVAYLKEVGVWQFLSSDACAIKTIDISDRGHYGKARVNAHDHKVTALGHVVAMALIGKAQLKALANKNNVQWFTPNHIIDINWQTTKNNKKIAVKLNSKQYLQTSLLLACDGANSPCRQLAGIKTNQSDYQQFALIANVTTTKAHKNKAYERFTQYGPLAMLPLPTLKNEVNGENRCSLVWTMSPEQSATIMALNDKAFLQQLELAFGSWLGAITHVGKREVYPLALMQAAQQTYHRMALIGNASHTIHPIAGQGFNLGLRDVQQMANLIKQTLANGGDIGSFTLLNKYSQKRQQDQNQVITLTDTLVTLFANDLVPLVAGRNVGLKIMNYVTPIKKILVNKFMGY